MSIYKGYSSRRASRDTLTGGTRDVNPQFMNLKVTQTAADAFTQAQFPVPVQRLPAGNRAQVMEVLKIYFTSSQLTTEAAASTAHNMLVTLTTKSIVVAQATIDEPSVFGYYGKNNDNAFTAAGTGLLAFDFEPYVLDLTDNAGHGFLIGTDSIYIQINSVATGNINNARVKILYRWKDVSMAEYVGMVQGQQ